MAPIAMFNALWFRPDGGAETYGRYGEAVLPILADVDADLLVPFLTVESTIEGGFDPEMIGVVRYPSDEAFDMMWQSDAYAEVAHLRTDALDRGVLTRCSIEPVDAGPCDFEPGIALVDMVWFTDGGRELYDDYLEQAAPLVEEHGGRVLSPRFVPETAYQGDVVPDLIVFGNYPSLDAALALNSSDAYRAGPETLRADAVARSMTSVLRVP